MNWDNHSKETARHWAAREGQEEAIGLLLRKGADPTLQDYGFRRPADRITENHPRAKEMRETLMNAEVRWIRESARTATAIAMGKLGGGRVEDILKPPARKPVLKPVH